MYQFFATHKIAIQIRDAIGSRTGLTHETRELRNTNDGLGVGCGVRMFGLKFDGLMSARNRS